MNFDRQPDNQRRPRGRVAVLVCVVGLSGGFSACSSLDEEGIGTTPTTVPATTTTVAPTTTTTAPTTTVSVLGSNQFPDDALPHTGPSEAAVLAAIGCALMVAGRLALDGFRWLDRLHLARTSKPKPGTPPR